MQLIAVLMGCLLGAFHVLAGPDHLAAIAPLSVVQTRRPWLAGARWGVGHSLGVLLVAAFAWFVRDLLPIESISAVSERLVGVMLLLIGFWGMRKAINLKSLATLHAPDSPSQHQPEPHDHPHTHPHPAGSLLVGILHGCAGSSHFFGVLPALALPKAAAAGYLVAFAAGTIAAMAAFSSVLGLLGHRLRRSGRAWYPNLMMTCSTAAIAVGAFWLIA